jgi:hypothetical protein
VERYVPGLSRPRLILVAATSEHGNGLYDSVNVGNLSILVIVSFS